MSEEDKPTKPANTALNLHLAQLDMENRLRMQRQSNEGRDAVKDTPRRGFGSAQGIAHLRHQEFQRRGPVPPAPAPVFPPPGQAKFGGTHITPPLPGIISGAPTPDNPFVMPPTPVIPRPSAPAPAAARAFPALPQATPPAMMTPSPDAPPSPKKERPAAVEPSLPLQAPAAAALDTRKGNVIGSGNLAKKPLPALYHAGVKAAENAEKSPSPFAPGPPTPRPSETVVIPEGSEVLKEDPSAPKAPKVKRFKNPTMTERDPSG